MYIKLEVLKYPNWWESDHPIYEAKETLAEFEKRQVYVYEKLIENFHRDTFDWREFNQLPEESSIDFAIRFNNEYAYLLDVSYFIPEFYEVRLDDYYKMPEIRLKKDWIIIQLNFS